MRSYGFAVLVACALAGCRRDAVPAETSRHGDDVPAVAAPDDAQDPVADRAMPVPDASKHEGDARESSPFADLSIPPSWSRDDAEYAADPLRCARMVRHAARAEGCDALPADVLAFLDRRASCEHWRGEPYVEPAELAAADPDERAALQARRDEIVRNARDECRGTDAALAVLRQRYAADGALQNLFGAFDDRIED